MVLEKQVDTWPKRSAGNSINDALYRGSIIGGTGRTSLEKDFPSLGVEVKKGPPDAGRVSFPGLNTVQSHPMGSASILGVDGWTSSLAEVPVVAGAIGPGLSSALQTTPVNQVTTALSTTKGLNMLEALTQGTSQVHTGPQLALHAQRVEELTLRQCKQLTPVMPSMPKTSVFNSSEKPKSKGARGGNFSALPKVGQQPSQLIKHSFLAPARSDIRKTSQSGNLQVLNRKRNAVSPTAKQGPSVSKAMSPVGIVPLAAVIPLKSPINSKVKVDNIVTALSPTQSSFGEKRPFYQAQNRNDFFNSIRKKALNCLSAIPETSCVTSSSNLEKSGEQIVETANHDSLNCGLNCSIENKKFEDFRACESMGLLPDGEENNLCLEPVVDPEEEAFLQSLGWDKNAGEEALTKEEIDAFVKEYEKRRQSSKLCPWEIKSMMAVLTEPPLSNIAGADGPRLSLFGSERVG